MQGRDHGAFGLLIIISAIWGGSFALIKIGLADFSPLQIVFLRTGIAGLVMIPVCLFVISEHRVRRIDLARICLLALIGYVLPFFLISWGELHIPSSLAAVIMATGPLVAFLVARLTGQEMMTPRKALGLLLGFLGVLLLIFTGTYDGAPSESAFAMGVAAVLIATFAYVGAGFLTKTLNHIPSTLLTAMTLIIASAASAIALSINDESLLNSASIRSWTAIIVLGVLCTAVAAMLRFILIRRSGYVFASYVGYLIPVFGILYGLIFLRETLEPVSWIAVALIAMGLLTFRTQVNAAVAGVRPNAEPGEGAKPCTKER